jgi:hypothetical protein
MGIKNKLFFSFLEPQFSYLWIDKKIRRKGLRPVPFLKPKQTYNIQVLEHAGKLTNYPDPERVWKAIMKHQPCG